MRTEHDATRADEAASLALFVEAEGTQLVRYAFLLTRNSDDAQDLVQAVLYRLAKRGIGALDDPISYARRCLINEHRSNMRRLRVRMHALARLQASDAAVPDHAGQVTSTRATLAALAALSPRQREAVVLRYYGDLSEGEIASALACAPGTVRSLLSRAMPVLRNALSETETPE